MWSQSGIRKLIKSVKGRKWWLAASLVVREVFTLSEAPTPTASHSSAPWSMYIRREVVTLWSHKPEIITHTSWLGMRVNSKV